MEEDKLLLRNLKEELNTVRKFIAISNDNNKLEKEIHTLIKDNFWLIDRDFQPFISNQRLSTYFKDKTRIMDENGKLRPDLICHPIIANKESYELLVIELKKPSITINENDLPQIFRYIQIISKKSSEIKKITLIIIGGISNFVDDISYSNCKIKFMTYETISQKLESIYKKYLDIYKEERLLSNRRSGMQYWVNDLPISDLEEVRKNTEKIIRFILKSRFSDALKTIEDTLLLVTLPSERAALLLIKGNCNYLLSEYDEAEKDFKDSIKVSEEASIEDKTLINTFILRNIGIIYKTKGDSDTALKYFKKALNIDKNFGNKQGEADDLSNIGLIYLHSSNSDFALKYLKETLDIHQKINDEQKEAYDLGYIGWVFREKGDLDTTLKYFEKALNIHKKIGDNQGKADDLGNIGLICSEKGDLDLALTYYQDALKINKEIEDKLGESYILGNIGLIYRKKSDLNMALKYCENALHINKEVGYKVGEAFDLGNIGNIYLGKGDLDTALKYYQEAINIYKELGNREEEILDLNNIGFIYIKKGDLDKALKYNLSALKMSKNLGLKRVEALIGKSVSLIYKKMEYI